ncbi:hypothetical protein L4174_020880 [Photobacterium sp. CCB-ST2H9]|uniref:hypothetical protein n=1 Tax=unclassified Photobacterium TaxID=2628852 RepID=UPI002003AF6B|nr:hypothetical protein [Photobacterium sp. CCB-ST2H9]UTM59167.1 hypothetical protein L4174_020880 [Photobacterium sp. CCB-ST2H9]
MTLRCKRLSTQQDLLEFAEHYHAISGNSNTVEYLRHRSCVKAFYDSEGKMCAGFTVNSRTPLTYLSDLPPQMGEHPLQLATGNIVEGGGLWVMPDLNDFERGYVFIYACWEAYRMKKRYFMSGARNPKVAARQKFVYPHVLYEGPTEKFDYACILYCKRQYILIQIGLFVSRYWITQPLKKLFRGLTQLRT